MVFRKTYDAIIIGGGHNGLVTAALLREGKRVLVLERRRLVGGCSVTEEIWPGYRVSTAAYLSSLLQDRIVQDLDLEHWGYRIDAKDPSFFSPFPDDRWPLFGGDEKKTLEEIAKFLRPRRRDLSEIREAHPQLARFVESLLLTTPPGLSALTPRATFLEYLKIAARVRKLSRRETVGLVKIFTQERQSSR